MARWNAVPSRSAVPGRVFKPMLKPTQHLLLTLLLACVPHVAAVAQSVFYTANVEDGLWPAAFDLGAPVERLDAEGNGTGEFVPAWRIGTAAEANEGGFFPVPDLPTGNRFAMANDDAEPCNCDHGQSTLTLALPSLAGRSNVALACRVFHERILDGGDALVEASVGGGAWILLATVPVRLGDWQDLFVNLSAFDGLANVRLRFRWSDNGAWAAGFALDDIQLLDRAGLDLAVQQVRMGDANSSPFVANGQTLNYRQLPLEQAGAIVLTAELMNRGSTVITDPVLTATLALNGTGQWTLDSTWSITLLPGERRWITWATGWVPAATGALDLTLTAQPSGNDEVPGNNTGTGRVQITGPGWEQGYAAMALDHGAQDGTAGGEEAFILLSRMQLVQPGSVARGITVQLNSASNVGAVVRAALFDANLAFVDSSIRHTLTQEDIDRAWNGEPLFLAFSGLPELAATDHFVGIQKLEGAGNVFVGLSGNGPVGSSLELVGSNFITRYLRSIPMVRMHLQDYGVGMHEHATVEPGLWMYPVPVHEQATLRFQSRATGIVQWQVMDALGRTVTEGTFGAMEQGEHQRMLDLGALPAGSYLLRVASGQWGQVLRFVKAR